jgi:hypothetical protein
MAKSIVKSNIYFSHRTAANILEKIGVFLNKVDPSIHPQTAVAKSIVKSCIRFSHRQPRLKSIVKSGILFRSI